MNDVLESAVSIVKFIRILGLYRRESASLLVIINSEYKGFLRYTLLIRWLSRDKLMKAFYNLKIDVILFL